MWAVRRAPPRRGAWFGFVFGAVYYGVLLYWLLRFGLLAWGPLVLSQAAYAGLFGLLAPLLWRDRAPVSSALAVAALWTGADWARGAWPLGGFTWGALGATQHGNPLVLPLASVTGVWGVTFVVVAVNGLLLGTLGHRKDRRRAGASLAVAALLATAPGLVPAPVAGGPTVDVAVVQGNVPKERARNFFARALGVAQDHVRLNRELAADPPQVAVWPENSLDVDPAADPELGRAVTESIRAVGAPTLVGAVTEAPEERFHNQVLHYSPQGRVVDRYSKMHPVPFGEYVPFRSLLGWVDQLRAVPRDIAPGDEATVFEVDGVRIGTPICFENTIPGLVRRFTQGGAEILVVATNDSSFVDSPASREHVIMSQLRAVENGRWVVQAAISGISAIIAPDGRIVAQTQEFVQAILRADVPTATARTLYVRFGDWFPWTSGILAAALAAWRFRSARRGSGGSDEGSTAPAAPPAGERGVARAPRAPIAGGAPRVLVILPTYNERETVARVLGGVLDAGPAVEALVVDDGSPDGTAEIVAALARDEPRIRLLQRPGKQGLASAYLLGFRRGLEEGFDVIVEMDADLSHRPQDLPGLIAGSERHDLTIGSRYVPGGGVTNWSRGRVALSRAGNAYARLVLGLPLTDSTSGFRAFRRGLLQALVSDGITSDGYAFQIELAYRAWRMGFAVGEVPIVFREREHGRSKISRRIVVEALWKVGRWGVRDRILSRRGRAAPPASVPRG